MPSDFNINLGKKIRESRKERNISLNMLATAMGVSYQQLQKYETGTNRISAEKLFQLSNVLRLKAEYFFPDYEADVSVFESPIQRIERNVLALTKEYQREYIADIVEKTAGFLTNKSG